VNERPTKKPSDDGPFCWQSAEAVLRIRNRFEKHLAYALALYLTLTDVAREERSATFKVRRRELARPGGNVTATAFLDHATAQGHWCVGLGVNESVDSRWRPESIHTSENVGRGHSREAPCTKDTTPCILCTSWWQLRKTRTMHSCMVRYEKTPDRRVRKLTRPAPRLFQVTHPTATGAVGWVTWRTGSRFIASNSGIRQRVAFKMSISPPPPLGKRSSPCGPVSQPTPASAG